MTLIDINIDIDGPAATARLQEIAATHKAALDTRLQRITELDSQAKEAFDRDEAELKAAKERAADKEPEPKATPKPKRTLALGADEFKEAREARQAEPIPDKPEPTPAPEKPEKPVEKDEAPRRTFRLGASEDRETPGLVAAKPQDRPARPRPSARDDGDGDGDDQSGRTWLR